MQSDNRRVQAQALEEIVEQERSALLEGDLERLSQMLPRKEQLIEDLNGLEVLDSDDLIRLQAKVNRNQSLLSSAAEGIRAVADRMAELRKVRQEFTTYDATGQRTGHAVRHAAKLEKRA